MFISKKHLSRRTFLRGAGVTLALPYLDAMLPAQTPLSQVVGLRECTAVLSAARWPSPLMMFRRSRNGSSGLRIGEISNPEPSVAGVHLSMIAPCGT